MRRPSPRILRALRGACGAALAGGPGGDFTEKDIDAIEQAQAWLSGVIPEPTDRDEEIQKFLSNVLFTLRVMRDLGKFDDMAGSAGVDPHNLILKASEILEVPE